MRKIIKAYQYLFYKFYRFFESMSYPWWSEHKAALVVDVLLFFILTDLSHYYSVFIDKHSNFLSTEKQILASVLIIFIFNHYLFIHKDKWKSIVEEFDKLPKKKNKIGGWLVVLFICLVAANFIYSFYLFSQID